MAIDTSCSVFLLVSGSLTFAAGQEIKTGICYHGWHYYEEHCYGLGGNEVTWADAEDICKTFDAGLAEIETAEENQFVKNLVRTQLNESAWLGGTDIFSDGYWEWSSSKHQITGFTDWTPGEPSQTAGVEGEDCLQFFSNQNFTWNNAECNLPEYFVCEGLPQETIIIVG